MPSQCCRAHAALSPWQGQNALDAAVAAYTNVALLRQQVKPSHRIHGVFEGKDWAVNGGRFQLLCLHVHSSTPLGP
jgi:metal-dependent amidase/aminoacylase/carboxypeptidase family protein